MSASKNLLVTIIALAVKKNGGPIKISRDEVAEIHGKQVTINEVIGGDCDLIVDLEDKPVAEGVAS